MAVDRVQRGRGVPADVVGGDFGRAALAALAWWWRNYAMNSGIGGWLASAPITFDARQWKRQVRRARGVNKAPGNIPLLRRGGLIPGVLLVLRCRVKPDDAIH